MKSSPVLGVISEDIAVCAVHGIWSATFECTTAYVMHEICNSRVALILLFLLDFCNASLACFVIDGPRRSL